MPLIASLVFALQLQELAAVYAVLQQALVTPSPHKASVQQACQAWENALNRWATHWLAHADGAGVVNLSPPWQETTTEAMPWPTLNEAMAVGDYVRQLFPPSAPGQLTWALDQLCPLPPGGGYTHAETVVLWPGQEELPWRPASVWLDRLSWQAVASPLWWPECLMPRVAGWFHPPTPSMRVPGERQQVEPVALMLGGPMVYCHLVAQAVLHQDVVWLRDQEPGLYGLLVQQFGPHPLLEAWHQALWPADGVSSSRNGSCLRIASAVVWPDGLRHRLAQPPFAPEWSVLADDQPGAEPAFSWATVEALATRLQAGVLGCATPSALVPSVLAASAAVAAPPFFPSESAGAPSLPEVLATLAEAPARVQDIVMAGWFTLLQQAQTGKGFLALLEEALTTNTLTTTLLAPTVQQNERLVKSVETSRLHRCILGQAVGQACTATTALSSSAEVGIVANHLGVLSV